MTVLALDRETGPAGAVRWSLFLWPPFIIAALLLVLPHGAFLWTSLHKTTGLGEVSAALTLENYGRVLTDPLYLGSLWLTFYLSAIAALVGLIVGFPCAYALVRMRSRAASHLVVLLLISSFITVVIKVLGLSLLLGQNGVVNDALQALGLVAAPVRFLNNELGVLIGLVQYTLAIFVVMLFGVLQTIPFGLEQAAEIHGATWISTMRRVVIPLARPGIVAATLISFNLNMGAFTSAVLLGGGKVTTLPVLIQRKVSLDVDYSMGATLSTVLLVLVFVINLVAARFTGARHGLRVTGSA